MLEHVNVVLQEQAKEVVPLLATAAGFLAERGWWVLNDWSAHTCIELLKLKDQLDEPTLTAEIIAYANDSRYGCLSGAPQRWSNVAAFRSRQPIFEECFWAHENQKYALVVTTALVNVEGIVRDCLRGIAPAERQGFRFDPVRRQFAQRLQRLQQLPATDSLTWNDLRAVENYHNLNILEGLFANFDPAGTDIPAALNRHAVAHGRKVDLGSLELSTKSLLLLDMLHSVCEDVQQQNVCS